MVQDIFRFGRIEALASIQKQKGCFFANTSKYCKFNQTMVRTPKNCIRLIVLLTDIVTVFSAICSSLPGILKMRCFRNELVKKFERHHDCQKKV